MESNQIYISTLKTAIQKALTKNLPLILADAVEYLENHDFQVKQRKKRTKNKAVQNIDDLQKKTQSKSAQKMKSTAYLNLNTNRVNSDSKKIKKKHPKLQFGNLKQDDKIVWVCGTPGHLQNALDTLKQTDEKSEPIFEPSSPLETISESEESESEESELVAEESDEEAPEAGEPVAEESDEEEPPAAGEPVAEPPVEEVPNEEAPVAEESVEEPVSNAKDWKKTFDELSENESLDKLTTEINNLLEPPLVSAPIILKGTPKPKKLKRRKKKKHSKSKTPTKSSEKLDSIYADFEQRGTIF